VRWRDAGHLLGSASIDVVVREGDRQVHVLFSGDVGRYGMPLNHDPTPPGDADYLLVESTYGDRLHPSEPPAAALEGVLRRMLERRGVLLVPAFAIGRAQQIIYLTLKLIRDGSLPAFPIYLDSPMAVDATAIYCKYLDDHPLRLDQLQGDDCVLSGPNLHFTHSMEDSKRLNDVLGPAVIISSSGMLTGGRILHHLVRRLPDPKNLVALVGYQAAGTRGRMLQEGAKTLPILGEQVPVRAELADLGHLSGHGDRDELLRWMDGMPSAPKRVFVTHGEPAASAALAEAVHARRGWDVLVPQHGQRVDL
jgi:metallo-beta-lactamase family protein